MSLILSRATCFLRVISLAVSRYSMFPNLPKKKTSLNLIQRLTMYFSIWWFWPLHPLPCLTASPPSSFIPRYSLINVCNQLSVYLFWKTERADVRKKVFGLAWVNENGFTVLANAVSINIFNAVRRFAILSIIRCFSIFSCHTFVDFL